MSPRDMGSTADQATFGVSQAEHIKLEDDSLFIKEILTPKNNAL
jgi:hypothetical protein